MTIQQFQYILEVYRAGSVSQAAKNLFVGQSSVSLSITNLEKELGYPIFHRSKNGVTPTRRGMEVIEHAARICESCRIISAPARTDCAQLRIGVGGFEVARRAVSRLLAENRDRRDLAFSFLQMSQSEQIRQLSLFELDMSLCFVFAPRIRQLEARLRAKGLQWQELTKFPAAIQLGPGHRLYHAEHVEVAMLEEEYKLLAEVDSIVDKYYIGEYVQDDLMEGAAAGYVEALGDPWSSYYTAEEYAQIQSVQDNSYMGIGITITTAENDPYRITSVISGSPAQQAGIAPMDRLHSVDGRPVGDFASSTELVNAVLGEAGTRVTVEIPKKRGMSR